ERIRREDNLLCVPKRGFVVTTDSRHQFRLYPNLARSVEPMAINQLWVFETRLLPEPRLPLAASAAPATDTMTAIVCV
ncbi:MAG TPA: hypothetical protein VK741_29320, partial [Acetobacteraceae bacterium]|nr:hypothetical protein [Acetobacteraceae bacterium]